MNNTQRSFRMTMFTILTVLFAGECFGSEVGNDPKQAIEPNTYRVSSQADFDLLKPLVFNGGDQILFERGKSFQGALSLKRSKLRPNQVITVGDFGSPEAPRPVITADAHGMGTIDIRDSGGWTIENLELSNQAAERSERMGIFVMATSSGTHKNFIVRNCFIHDVTGEFKNFNNGGIIFRVTGESVPTKFDGVLIENNEIRNISGVGIRTKSTWESSPEEPRGLNRYLIGRHAHLGVVVRGNRISDITRNAITDLVVSNNTFYSTHPDMKFFMNHKQTREAIDTTLIDNVFVFAGEGASWGSVPSYWHRQGRRQSDSARFLAGQDK